MTSQEAYGEAEKAGESLLVSSMSAVLLAQVAHCFAKPRKVCSDVEKDEKSPLVSPMSIDLLEQVTHCLVKP